MNHSKRRAAVRIGLGAVLLLLLGAVFVLNFPFPVSREISALEISLDDPSYRNEVHVSISGTLYLSLFEDSYLEGQFSVDAYPQTADGTFHGLSLRSAGRSLLTYKYPVSTNPSGTHEYRGWALGQIFYQDGFSHAVILVAPEEDSTGQTCIVFDVQTRQEALDAMEKSGAGCYLAGR